MDSKYNFKELEPQLYGKWESSGIFTPKMEEGKDPFTIIMPPPNANGVLHAGHALFVTLQDILVRYHRMKGDPTLWLPGADHAGIATQVTYEKILNKQDKNRFDLGREEFVKQVFDFSQSNRSTMENQLRQLGASCDWSRMKFTLDPDISKAVVYMFKKMYDEGLIYKGERIINWCARCATGVSDIEVEYQEEKGALTYIKYKVDDGTDIVVATTRPETLLGDTAVAVHPEDKRYQKLIGRTVTVPIVDREVPIVGDESIDPKFGTGAVKVTPAHDPLDFEIGERHNLPRISVIGKTGRMTEAAGEYKDQKIKEARENVLAKLQELGLVEKQQEHVHNVGHCERCGTVIEPLLSEQWFVKIQPLAEPAIRAVEEGKIEFVPKRFEKIYLNWMKNIRDWNISRQLWWGHQIPVYYLKSDPSKMVVAESMAEAKKQLGGEAEQDADTLDTWYSSGMWPFTTLGWPEQTQDFKYFYPTSVMETGWDIIFFWVARMIMMGLYATGEAPFKVVYIHGLVNDEQGKKMSKSKGNGVDPIQMVESYGADALRMALIVGNKPGTDQALSENQIRGYRNFGNKLWNIARFIDLSFGAHKKSELNIKAQDATTKEFYSAWTKTKKEIEGNIQNFRIDLAADTLYHFAWDVMADQYLEYSKSKTEDEAVGASLWLVLRELLITLHPFVPFVTEAIWQELFEGELIAQEWVA